MLTIHYFASIRETLSLSVEELELPDSVQTVSTLIDYLISLHGPLWAKTLQEKSVLVAVNQNVVKLSATIRQGDEVAFFPPVTGG